MDEAAGLPVISIVMPSFNQGMFIEQAITSVLGQFYPKLELIIMDGGSTDNTREIVEKYSRSIQHFVSEPDNGQANAINKGFRIASGDILGWLNSDDMYMPQTLFRAASAIGKTSEPALVYASCISLNENTKTTRTRIAWDFNADVLTYCDFIDQPTSFWSRRLWESTGELNEEYHYGLDWDWFIRASKICRFQSFSDCFAVYRKHESQKTRPGAIKRAEEILKIVAEYAEPKWIEIYQDVFRQLYLEDHKMEQEIELNLVNKIRWKVGNLLLRRFRPKEKPVSPSPQEIAISMLS